MRRVSKILYIPKERFRRILHLSLPIIGGMISQNILNLVDTGMVGTLGDSALAAVGIGSFATFMSQALVLGVSAGVQAIAARRVGEGKENESAFALNSGLALVLTVAPLLSALLYFLGPTIFAALNKDPEVISQGTPYYQVRVAAILFVGFNFSFRGFWNAIDMSRIYMSTLLVMHAANILFNYMFIFGNFGAPELGTYGAGLGTTLATVVGTVIYFFLGFKYASSRGFLKQRPRFEQLLSLVKLSLPNGIQQLFFSAGFVVMFYIIGKIGTAEVAAANVLINVMLVAILPALALGLAAATLVGQALGGQEIAEAKRWGWDVVKVGIIFLAVLGAPMWIAPDLVLAPFIYNEDTVAIARLPMQLIGYLIAFEAIGLVLMNALLGAGDAKNVMVVSITTQWIFFLPLAYLVGPYWGFGLLGVWLLQAGYRFLQTASFVWLWQRERWAHIKV